MHPRRVFLTSQTVDSLPLFFLFFLGSGILYLISFTFTSCVFYFLIWPLSADLRFYCEPYCTREFFFSFRPTSSLRATLFCTLPALVLCEFVLFFLHTFFFFDKITGSVVFCVDNLRVCVCVSAFPVVYIHRRRESFLLCPFFFFLLISVCYSHSIKTDIVKHAHTY